MLFLYDLHSGALHSDINSIPTLFIKAAEMGNMDHVCIFMMGNDFDIDLYGRFLFPLDGSQGRQTVF